MQCLEKIIHFLILWLNSARVILMGEELPGISRLSKLLIIGGLVVVVLLGVGFSKYGKNLIKKNTNLLSSETQVNLQDPSVSTTGSKVEAPGLPGYPTPTPSVNNMFDGNLTTYYGDVTALSVKVHFTSPKQVTRIKAKIDCMNPTYCQSLPKPYTYTNSAIVTINTTNSTYDPKSAVLSSITGTMTSPVTWIAKLKDTANKPDGTLKEYILPSPTTSSDVYIYLDGASPNAPGIYELEVYSQDQTLVTPIVSTSPTFTSSTTPTLTMTPTATITPVVTITPTTTPVVTKSGKLFTFDLTPLDGSYTPGPNQTPPPIVQEPSPQSNGDSIVPYGTMPGVQLPFDNSQNYKWIDTGIPNYYLPVSNPYLVSMYRFQMPSVLSFDKITFNISEGCQTFDVTKQLSAPSPISCQDIWEDGYIQSDIELRFYDTSGSSNPNDAQPINVTSLIPNIHDLYFSDGNITIQNPYGEGLKFNKVEMYIENDTGLRNTSLSNFVVHAKTHLPDYQPKATNITAKLHLDNSQTVDATLPIGLARKVSTIEFNGIEIKNNGLGDAPNARILIYIKNPSEITDMGVIKDKHLSNKKIKVYDGFTNKTIKAGQSYIIPSLTVNISKYYDDFPVFENNNMANFEIVIDPLNKIKELYENNNSVTLCSVKWANIDVYYPWGERTLTQYLKLNENITITIVKDDGSNNGSGTRVSSGIAYMRTGSSQIDYYYPVTYDFPSNNLKYFVKTSVGSTTLSFRDPTPLGYVVIDKYLTYHIAANPKYSELKIVPKLVNMNDDRIWAVLPEAKIYQYASITIQKINNDGSGGPKFTSQSYSYNINPTFDLGMMSVDDIHAVLTPGKYKILNATVEFEDNYGDVGNLGVQTVTATYPEIDQGSGLNPKPLQTNETFDITAGYYQVQDLNMYLKYKCFSYDRPDDAGPIPICVYTDTPGLKLAGYDGNTIGQGYVYNIIIKAMNTAFRYQDLQMNDNYINGIVVVPFLRNNTANTLAKFIIYDSKMMLINDYNNGAAFHEMAHFIDYYFNISKNADYRESIATSINGVYKNGDLYINPVWAFNFWEYAAGQCANMTVAGKCYHHPLAHEYDPKKETVYRDGIFQEVFAEQFTSACYLSGKAAYQQKLIDYKNKLIAQHYASEVIGQISRQIEIAQRVKGELHIYDSNGSPYYVDYQKIKSLYDDPECKK